MSDSKNVSPLFWVVGALFLLWNIVGCYFYIMGATMSDETYGKEFGEQMLALRDDVPPWTTGAFALAVFSGLLASIMFLMRKKIAFPIFVVSLIFAVISFIWGLTTPEYIEAAKAVDQNPYFMPVLVTVLGIVEVIVSRMKVKKGILT